MYVVCIWNVLSRMFISPISFLAKAEEELQNQKLTNQMFVQAKEEETSLNAATFISVVSFFF